MGQAVGSAIEDLGIIARESLYIYSASLVASAAGFLYWVVAAKLVPSRVLGTASTIISLASITITLFTLGLSSAILRVGSLYRDVIGKVTWTSLVMSLGATLLAAVGGLVVYSRVLGAPDLALLVAVLALAWAPATALGLSLIATRRARHLLYVQALGAATKMCLGAALLLVSPSITSVAMGYLDRLLDHRCSPASYSIAGKLLELATTRTIAAELLRAGIPVWLPSIIACWGHSWE